jgi:hypothetical protein
LRAPISFVYGNCVFGSELDDVWAAFTVPVHSYEWLSDESKQAWFARLVTALGAVQADFQILRVARRVDADSYTREMERLCGGARAGLARRYIREQSERVRAIEGGEPAVYLLVSLREPRRDVVSYVSKVAERDPRDWLGSLKGALRPREKRLLAGKELERVRESAERTRARLSDFLDARPARGTELQWLVRRAFCRGLGEPPLDGLHEPRALVFECNGQAQLAPLEGDVVRWMDSFVEHRGRCLRVESELGESWQALLTLGALPESVEFPGSRAELMFAPIERLPFAVDVSVNARLLPNELAVRVARRRVQDADQIVQAESDGELGVSDVGHRRSHLARDLLGYLQRANRPPLLRCTITLAVGASSGERLDERVELCRRAYGEVSLHRPLGEQLRLFVQHLPAQRTRVTGYDDTLTLEQVAAMMPLAAHVAGSRSGFYLGHTLSRSRRPIRFNLGEGSERDRNTTILSVGSLGSGKTTLAQKLAYEGFLQGARVIDCDPKGDHRFHLLEEVAPHAETIALRPDDPSLRGVLDPLRVAPSHLRHDAAVSFICDLLPARAEPAWETAVLTAVDRVMRCSPTPTCMEVVNVLLAGEPIDVQVGRTIEVYARSGLTQLGFADGPRPAGDGGERQVTYISIRDLPGPQPGTSRGEYSQSERVGAQIVRLIAMFAMDLMSRERDRLKLFCFDEGWRLLGDPVGRMLLASLQRMGRSELAVPIVSTQLVGDALVGERESLENLLGATFVFGMRSPAEAGRALELLGLDPQDRRARELLLDMDAGRCLFRDHLGRIEALRVEVVAPWLARTLSTTPSSR